MNAKNFFPPIAIVGRACRLPGIDSPEQLWQAASGNADLLRRAPEGRWRLPLEDVLGGSPDNPADRTWSDRGGYVDLDFRPEGFALPPEHLVGLGPVAKLALTAARDALADAGIGGAGTGLIMGNLGFPTEGLSAFAEGQWLGADAGKAGIPEIDARARFGAGLPAHLVAAACGLDREAYALDAACASSLYAIELACRALHDGRADAMVAGAVNRCDDLFIHVGFAALKALSKTGQSRPFHAEADGLLPAEGAAFVVLERLEDAVAKGHRILGVIRGVGLANDGRGRGFLAPASEGQVRSMEAAFAQSGLRPEDIGYVECHATGTTVGDATELRSLSEVYPERQGALPIGSFKGNIGHAITAAGTAGLIKVLEALRHGVIPPSPHVGEGAINPAVAEAGCRVLAKAEPWTGPRRAAVSAFGFGGNDAHLIVEDPTLSARQTFAAASAPSDEPIVVVGIGARVGDGQNAADFAAALRGAPVQPRAEEVRLPLKGLRFPPNDLQQTLAQQTMLFAAALEAVDGLELNGDRCGIFVGAQCDAEVARYGARWRAQGWERSGVATKGDDFIAVLQSAGVLGTMPNIPANRLSSQFDFRGPSYTIASEELSGIRALEVAMRALSHGELDAALVGASDLSCEAVHEAAAEHLGLSGPAGDAALMLVLMRQSDAVAAGLPMLASIEGAAPGSAADGLADAPALLETFGRSHAAFGLLRVGAAVLRCAGGEGNIHLDLAALGGQRSALRVGHLASASIAAWAPAAPVLKLPAHPPAVSLAAAPKAPVTAPVAAPPAQTTSPAAATPRPAPTVSASESTMPNSQKMPPAPTLPSVFSPVPSAASAPVATTPVAATAPVATPAPVAAPVATPAPVAEIPSVLPPLGSAADALLAQFAEQQRLVGEMHAQFLQQQTALHEQFLASRQRSLALLQQVAQGSVAPAQLGASQPAMTAPAAPQRVAPIAKPAAPIAKPAAPVAKAAPIAKPAAPVAKPAAPVAKPVAAKPVAKPAATKPVASKPAAPKPAASKPAVSKFEAATGLEQGSLLPTPVGRTWSREDLVVHASGQISSIFGPEFAEQDQYAVQVRMPEPPLLLADRVVGVDAKPLSMGKGRLWTETDVNKTDWFIHQGRMPAGIMIESGQADLFLISYLGVDLLNKGDRAYRLLGCKLTYHGNLPRTGETLRYAIDVDGHANQGDIRLFFFHYDCELELPDGTCRKALSVRGGQAGFFTEGELEDSAGVLWTPEEQELVANPRLATPVVPLKKKSFSHEEVAAFAAGDLVGCFGEGFELGLTHNRAPRIASGEMTLMGEVTEVDHAGGPWKRGYLRSEYDFSPDDWFFEGHFNNDPCMPGTLMFEGCLQTMAFYMASMGLSLDKDGWRFEPLPDHEIPLICRGQALPNSKKLVYEVFVEEVVDGPEPILYADLLCTVDGLKAFHARRMALRLTPDFPLREWTELLEDYEEPKPCAIEVWKKDPLARPFTFDYASLLACAWGQPSKAFGPMYERFDGTRKVARLPGPPYHFMSRVTKTDGKLGECKAGAKITIEYDIPLADEWYFRESAPADGTPGAMPFAVLLEAALQPCGWLASYVGSALTADEDLSFRNLDGKGRILKEIWPSDGVFRTDVEITNVSMSAGMIIQSFDVHCTIDDEPVYELKTVFGFFPKAALENQIGLPTSPEQRAMLEAPSDYLVDLKPQPEKYCGLAPRLPDPMLLMVDRVTAFEAKGGKAGLGFLRGEKDVDPGEWFFKAHFFQDPVQPGSLGLEAMLQLLMYYGIEMDLAANPPSGAPLENPRFESIALGDDHLWKYRGQVVPKNKLIGSTMEIVEVVRDDKGVAIYGDGSLWVDGKRIYESQRFGVRIVSGVPGGDLSGKGKKPSVSVDPNGRDRSPRSPKATKSRITKGSAAVQEDGDAPSTGSSKGASALTTASAATVSPATVSSAKSSSEHTYDTAKEPWLLDHRPTYTLPALPLMGIVDRMVAATGAKALSDVQVRRWVTIDGQARTKVEVEGDEVRLLLWRDARDARLSRFEVAATAKLATPTLPEAGPLGPLEDVPSPYANLFHGPAFHLLRSLRSGPGGARAILDAGAGAVPYNAVHPGLLDAATHAIPHDALEQWFDALKPGLVAYPYRLDVVFHRALPKSGDVLCEVQKLHLEDGRFPHFHLRLFAGADLCVEMLLKEVLLPKGNLGNASPGERRAFLEEKRFVPGVALSEQNEGKTQLRQSEVKGSNWLPGTLESVYDSRALTLAELTADIAVKEHIAAQAEVHPSKVVAVAGGAVLGTEPLKLWPLEVGSADPVAVRSTGAPALHLKPVKDFWASRFGLEDWPVADLYYGLAERFLEGVVLEDPEAFAAIRGRSALFLGNHQTGIESLLFSIVASALIGTPTLTLAKSQHRESWLGKLIELGFQYPGAHDPGVIAFFERDDPASLPRIVGELAGQAEAKSLLVHVEGTRRRSCREPVERMSSVFVDLALKAKLPIVPVRFIGGVPVKPSPERLEFPIGYGQQRYALGTPLLPEQLSAMPFKERTETVLRAINGLGDAATEEPFAGDTEFAAKVAARIATGQGEPQAVAHEVLAESKSPSAATKRFLAGDRGGDDGVSAWLRKFEAWLG